MENKQVKKDTLKVFGCELPIVGYQKANLIENGEVVGHCKFPMVEMDGDYIWMLNCLYSRIKNPESYKNENVEETIAELRQWLKEHEYMRPKVADRLEQKWR